MYTSLNFTKIHPMRENPKQYSKNNLCNVILKNYFYFTHNKMNCIVRKSNKKCLTQIFSFHIVMLQKSLKNSMI